MFAEKRKSNMSATHNDSLGLTKLFPSEYIYV
jgi:hypothetical protein